MHESPAVASALATFFAKNVSGDTRRSTGSCGGKRRFWLSAARREWFAGQEAARGAYGLEGFLIDPGHTDAWENGDTGWAVARPEFSIQGGPTFRLRFTAVFVREDGLWKLIHLHASYPVPDEVAVEHAEWWDAA